MNRTPDEICDNELYVHPWSLKRLKPCNILKVKNIMIDPNEEIPTSKWLFVPRLPRRSPETVPVWTLGTLGAHNS
jgi:hypothetical protein